MTVFLRSLWVTGLTAAVFCAFGADLFGGDNLREAIDLAGTWRFAIDREDDGEAADWFAGELPEQVTLPGSMRENSKGNEISIDTQWTGTINDRSFFTEERYAPYRQAGNVKIPFWLTPNLHYIGPAWYQRDIVIPKAWQGRRVMLFLERPHWETTIWLDQQKVGSQNALATPHQYDLGVGLEPGRHRLTIRVDNRVKIGVGVNAHSVTDHTQTNWNGIVGRIELRSTPPLWIDDVQIYPNVDEDRARVRVTVNSTAGRNAKDVKVQLQARRIGAAGRELPVQELKIDVQGKSRCAPSGSTDATQPAQLHGNRGV